MFVTASFSSFIQRLFEVPASGYRNNNDGSLNNVGNNGNYWSVTPESNNAYNLNFNNNGNVNPSNNNNRANGQAVRCLQEYPAPAKKGVKFELVDADGKVVDKFVSGADVDPFGEEPLAENKEASFSRVPNGTGEWAYAAPTPGEANGEKTGDIENR